MRTGSLTVSSSESSAAVAHTVRDREVASSILASPTRMSKGEILVQSQVGTRGVISVNGSCSSIGRASRRRRSWFKSM